MRGGFSTSVKGGGGTDRTAELVGNAGGQREGPTPARNGEGAAERCGSSCRCTSAHSGSNCCLVRNPSTLSCTAERNVTSSPHQRPRAPLVFGSLIFGSQIFGSRIFGSEFVHQT